MRRYPVINIQRAILAAFALFWLALAWLSLLPSEGHLGQHDGGALTPDARTHPSTARLAAAVTEAEHQHDARISDATNMILLVGATAGLVGALWGSRFVYLLGLSLFTVSLLCLPLGLVASFVWQCWALAAAAVGGEDARTGTREQQSGKFVGTGAEQGEPSTTGDAAGGAGVGDVSGGRAILDAVVGVICSQVEAIVRSTYGEGATVLLLRVCKMVLVVVNLLFLRGCFAVLTEYIFDEDLPENVNLLLFRWDRVAAADVLPHRRDSRHTLGT